MPWNWTEAPPAGCAASHRAPASRPRCTAVPMCNKQDAEGKGDEAQGHTATSVVAGATPTHPTNIAVLVVCAPVAKAICASATSTMTARESLMTKR